MTRKAYSRPNLGQGDQWAREIQQDLIGALSQLQQVRQQVVNLARQSNTGSTITQRLHREVEAAAALLNKGGESSTELANRIGFIENFVKNLDLQVLPTFADQKLLASASLTTAYAALGSSVTFEVPRNARFAIIDAQAYLQGASTTGTPTVSQIIRINGADVPASESSFGLTVGLPLTGTAEATLQLDLGDVKTAITIAQVAKCTVAVTGMRARLSARVTFQ